MPRLQSTVGGWTKTTNTRTHPRNHGKGRTWELTPDIFQMVHEACPDVLLMPENQLMRHHAYSAPYNNYPGHGTARKIRSAWPGAFGIFTLYTHPASNQGDADSHPKCNTASMEHLGGGPVVEALSRPIVQLPSVAG